ncbi:MAG TPA: YdbL family protein [Spongiibacteraceae bacterium]|nr:YdbL family protein [Spongiibacteraceae bacterium]
MTKLLRLVAVLSIALSSLAFALDLDAAKQQGLVGEQPNGYLGVVKATPDAVQLVSDINAKRRQAYERIARDNGITLEQVSTLAGQKAIEKSAPGAYIQTPAGQWLQK